MTYCRTNAVVVGVSSALRVSARRRCARLSRVAARRRPFDARLVARGGDSRKSALRRRAQRWSISQTLCGTAPLSDAARRGVRAAAVHVPNFKQYVEAYLAMPSTSCDVERVFGIAGRQFDGREALSRSRLEDEVRLRASHINSLFVTKTTADSVHRARLCQGQCALQRVREICCRGCLRQRDRRTCHMDTAKT